MTEEIQSVLNEVLDYKITDKNSLENFKRDFIGKNGKIQSFLDKLKTLSKEEKALVGRPLNELKQKAEEKFKEAAEAIQNAENKNNKPDLSLPGVDFPIGTRHPLSLVMNKITSVFQKIGFQIADGPEIEDDWHNFSALNFADNHPARDMQDTFFLENEEPMLLRTHTSSVQVRILENNKPPVRVLMPGRVYRNEAISARAHCFFHQVEGLVIDKNVSFADLKQTLLYFCKELFGKDVKIRLRPSYFPFTEISAEMDISCLICKGEGCTVCKGEGWVEILGCGMVDPNVLQNCGIDPEEYSGYAFGMGVERIAQLLYRVPDLRLYSQNDLRFLENFKVL